MLGTHDCKFLKQLWGTIYMEYCIIFGTQVPSRESYRLNILWQEGIDQLFPSTPACDGRKVGEPRNSHPPDNILHECRCCREVAKQDCRVLACGITLLARRSNEGR
jgi:hypothetical protein